MPEANVIRPAHLLQSLGHLEPRCTFLFIFRMLLLLLSDKALNELAASLPKGSSGTKAYVVILRRHPVCRWPPAIVVQSLLIDKDHSKQRERMMQCIRGGEINWALALSIGTLQGFPHVWCRLSWPPLPRFSKHAGKFSGLAESPPLVPQSSIWQCG